MAVNFHSIEKIKIKNYDESVLVIGGIYIWIGWGLIFNVSFIMIILNMEWTDWRRKIIYIILVIFVT